MLPKIVPAQVQIPKSATYRLLIYWQFLSSFPTTGGRLNVSDAKSVASKAAEQEGQPQSKTLRATWCYIHSDRFWTRLSSAAFAAADLVFDRFDRTLLPVLRA